MTEQQYNALSDEERRRILDNILDDRPHDEKTPWALLPYPMRRHIAYFVTPTETQANLFIIQNSQIRTLARAIDSYRAALVNVNVNASEVHTAQDNVERAARAYVSSLDGVK